MTMMDFTRPKTEPKPPIEFRVDDDVFQAYPEIGGGLLMDTIAMDFGNLDMNLLQSLNLDDQDAVNQLDAQTLMTMSQVTSAQMKKTLEFMDIALLPASAERFAERMRSTENPIALEQAVEIGRWLLSQYGARPTGPSSPSSNGHDGTGTTSTAGAPAEA